MSKIVLLGPAHPLRGGLSNFNENLARAFQKKGHEVRIVTFSLQYPGILFPGKTQYTEEPAPEDLEIEVSVNSVNPLNWHRIGKKLKEEKPDILIPSFWLPFMGPSLGYISGMTRKNRHTRVIALVHNLIPHEKRPGDRLFTRYFTRRADAFMALSKEVLADIRSFEPGKPANWNPHPIYDHFGAKMNREAAIKKLGLDSEKKYLLFFGFIRHYKGLDLLLRAMAQAPLKEKEELNLLVAGEFYEKEEEYLNLIKELGIEEKVILHTRFIPTEDVAAYFSAADLVVQPYRSATQSGVTQIAYHFEVPMVVTDVGGLPEIVPNGITGMVSHADSRSLAQSIDAALKEENLRKFSENIKEEKKRFSWVKMVSKFEETAEELKKGI